MALVSSVVAASDDATHTQYNNLRQDVTQHTHEGTDTALVKADSIQTVTGDRTLTLPTGASDTLATLTASQTFTNKTLTTPTIASFVNANHDHSNAAGGGAAGGQLVYTRDDGSSPGTLTLDWDPGNSNKVYLLVISYKTGGNTKVACCSVIISMTASGPAITAFTQAQKGATPPSIDSVTNPSGTIVRVTTTAATEANPHYLRGYVYIIGGNG